MSPSLKEDSLSEISTSLFFPLIKFLNSFFIIDEKYKTKAQLKMLPIRNITKQQQLKLYLEVKYPPIIGPTNSPILIVKVFIAEAISFANNSSLYEGSWDYQYGYVEGDALKIQVKVVNGETIRLVTSEGHTTTTMGIDDTTKMVTSFDNNGISEAYQEIKGSVSGTKKIYFET